MTHSRVTSLTLEPQQDNTVPGDIQEFLRTVSMVELRHVAETQWQPVFCINPELQSPQALQFSVADPWNGMGGDFLYEIDREETPFSGFGGTPGPYCH